MWRNATEAWGICFSFFRWVLAVVMKSKVERWARKTCNKLFFRRSSICWKVCSGPKSLTLNVISWDNKISNQLIIILSKYSTFLTEKKNIYIYKLYKISICIFVNVTAAISYQAASSHFAHYYCYCCYYYYVVALNLLKVTVLLFCT